MTNKINLGCGYRKKEGYLNIDINPACNPDLVADALDLPLENKSTNEVFSKHFLEHFTISEADQLFKEINRVMVPYGRLEFIVDIGKSEKHLFSKDSTHKHRYSPEEMRELCQKNGFIVDELSWITYRSKRTLKLIKHKKYKIRLIARKPK